MLQLQRIISGGQTGIDQLALEVARSLGIPTGGVAPKGYRTETGPNSRLRDDYGLTEHESASYPSRTKSNVQQADGTLVFGQLTGGTKLTVDACQKARKPYLVNPTADQLYVWLIEYRIEVLNVAGNRESVLTANQLAGYRQILYDGLTGHQRLARLFGEQPAQWGLRGDPYLWAELVRLDETLRLPASADELDQLLRVLIKNLIGQELQPGLEVLVPRYQSGGMSSGMVSADFWLERTIPSLQQQLTRIIESKN